MSEFEVLDAATEHGRARWIERWSEWPDREVSAHPDYVRLFARPVDRTICLAQRSPDGAVLYPLIQRPLSAEPWASRESTMSDLITPYGYGGPFAWGAPEADRFWQCVDDWCESSEVVSSFARLSVFADQLLPFRGDVAERGPNVVRSLDLDDDALWMDYEHKVRKNVKKAERAGLTVLVDERGDHLDEFLEIYHSTMDRRDAAATYYFPRSFFEAIVRDLPGQFAFFHVLEAQRIVSTELVLVSTRHLYSFLGGTVADAFASRPNDLLKHAVVGWGRARGKSSFVLGGGYHRNDGIFRYKLAFAPGGTVPFRVGMRVHSSDRYAELIARRAEWERQQGRTWTPDPEFFPAYRGGTAA